MSKLRIVLAVLITVTVVLIASISVALAQGDEVESSGANPLATKVAELLGLDAVVVDGAINQARRELRSEIAQEKINMLIEKGKLTQEQADEKMESIRSMPEGSSVTGKPFFSSKTHYPRWKSTGHFYGLNSHLKGKAPRAIIEKKLADLVETGDMTSEEAEAKLKALRSHTKW